MTNVEEYDLVVLGSGEAGKYIAWTLAAQGQRAAVIERRYVGGSCPNIACLPSKNVIHSAKVISLLRRGMEFGVGSMEWAVDMAAVRARRGLGCTVRLEMALGLILLLAVGVLSSVFPAFDALQAQQQQGFIERANADGVDILVRVAPGEAGDNEIGVEFTDTRSGAEVVAPEVLLRLTALSMDIGTQQVQATSTNGLRYSARGSYFPMTGLWELEVIIRRTGFNDVRRIFELEIQDKYSVTFVCR